MIYRAKKFGADGLTPFRSLTGARLIGYGPADGLVFYAPLEAAAANAETGQALSSFAGVTFETVNGIPAARFSGQRIATAENAVISGAAARSVSFWIKSTEEAPYTCAAGLGVGGDRTIFNPGAHYGVASFTGWNVDIVTDAVVSDRMHHVCWTYNGTTLSGYVDGVQVYSAAQALNTGVGKYYLGGSGNGSWFYLGHLAAVRVYNKALDAAEIATLAAEFTV